VNVFRCVLLALAAAVSVQFAAVASDPSPPPPTQYVTDNPGILSAPVRSSIESELKNYEHTTGHQVIVWIGDTTGDEPLEQWTVDTAHRWGIGRKGQDDGAVLFVFMRDHKLRIEVGYGLEASLTDAQSSQIINTVITPRMRENDYDGAIQNGVDRMLVTITPSYASQIGHTVAAPESTETSDGNGNTLFGILAIFGIFLSFLVVTVFVRGMRYLVTLFTKGPAAAHKVWHDAWISSFAPGVAGGMFLSSGGSSGDSGDFGGFSGGGGDFGGGGASGSW
jgi:uncharacterized protein